MCLFMMNENITGKDTKFKGYHHATYQQIVYTGDLFTRMDFDTVYNLVC